MRFFITSRLNVEGSVTDTGSSNGSGESAKDETSTTDGATIMAAIKSLEAGIYQKFDAHAAEFRKEIPSLREEV